METECVYTVLGAPDDGISPCVLLTVNVCKEDGSSGKSVAQYLFGCSEGLSRLALEHKFRPTACLRAIFLASCAPNEAGGLPGD